MTETSETAACAGIIEDSRRWSASLREPYKSVCGPEALLALHGMVASDRAGQTCVIRAAIRKKRSG